MRDWDLEGPILPRDCAVVLDAVGAMWDQDIAYAASRFAEIGGARALRATLVCLDLVLTGAAESGGVDRREVLNAAREAFILDALEHDEQEPYL